MLMSVASISFNHGGFEDEDEWRAGPPAWGARKRINVVRHGRLAVTYPTSADHLRRVHEEIGKRVARPRQWLPRRALARREPDPNARAGLTAIPRHPWKRSSRAIPLIRAGPLWARWTCS